MEKIKDFLGKKNEKSSKSKSEYVLKKSNDSIDGSSMVNPNESFVSQVTLNDVDKMCNEKGQTLLLQSVIDEDRAKIKGLMEQGASLFVGDKSGQTPLKFVFEKNKIELFEFLVKNGPKDQLHQICLVNVLSFLIEKPEFFSCLLKCGIDLEGRDINGYTPLIHQAKRGNIVTVEFLLRNRANVEAEDIDGRTPLIHAVRENNSSTVYFLIIAGGANPLKLDKKGLRASDYALQQKNTKLYNYLIGEEREEKICDPRKYYPMKIKLNSFSDGFDVNIVYQKNK